MFAYIGATEGSGEVNPYFASDFNGSRNAGILTGAVHFAVPGDGSGDTQADLFVAYGGKWSPDGKTLPGAVLLEFNPFGSLCYSLNITGMIDWIQSFSERYFIKIGRYPVLYTNSEFWSGCTDNSAAFWKTNPLWFGG